MYKTFSGNEQTKYGIVQCEPFAKTEFEKLTGFKVQESGLLIDEHLSFLAASPDRLLDNNGTIEIKFPSTIKELTSKKAIEMGKLKLAILDNQGRQSTNKKNYNYYLQGMVN